MGHLMQDMWEDQQILARIAGPYGLPSTPSNGLTQGCSFSLIATNLTTTIWANMLTIRIPGIMGGAFVDDKTIRHL